MTTPQPNSEKHMTWEEFLSTFPALLIPIIFWLVYKVNQIEGKIISEIREDVSEMKTDIKWLVKEHRERHNK